MINGEIELHELIATVRDVQQPQQRHQQMLVAINEGFNKLEQKVDKLYEAFPDGDIHGHKRECLHQ